MATAEVCRRHGISGATLYKWEAKYGGLEVPEANPVAITSTISQQTKGLYFLAVPIRGARHLMPILDTDLLEAFALESF